MQTGASGVRPEFAAIQLGGAAISLIGVASMAALPLPDFRWYNRLAVVLIMGLCTCWIGVVGIVSLVARRPVDPVAFALVSLPLGLLMIGFLYSTIRTMHDLYPKATHGYVSAVKLMSIGIAVQLIPSLLGLVGVRLW